VRRTPVSRLTAVTDSSFGRRTRFTIAVFLPELYRTRGPFSLQVEVSSMLTRGAARAPNGYSLW
jgi:hypothetical protein